MMRANESTDPGMEMHPFMYMHYTRRTFKCLPGKDNEIQRLSNGSAIIKVSEKGIRRFTPSSSVPDDTTKGLTAARYNGSEKSIVTLNGAGGSSLRPWLVAYPVACSVMPP